MVDRAFRTAALVVATAVIAGVIAACGGGGSATGAVRAVDPCGLLTDAEIKTLIGTTRARRQPSGASHSACTLGDPAGKLSVRISLFGNADTAPQVFNDQMRFGQEPARIQGVGRGAFTVARADEVGLVVLTARTVLGVSLVTTHGPVGDRRGTLTRLTPVVRHAASRL